jgi:hypothetical protein
MQKMSGIGGNAESDTRNPGRDNEMRVDRAIT